MTLRPDPATGPLDGAFHDLVERRFQRLVRDNPVLATGLGLHQRDHELGDGSRAALLDELAADEAHLGAVEGLDPMGLSPAARVERDLEIHNLGMAIFDTAEVRIWERRSTALDLVGDGLFLLFARDHAPLPERLDAIAGRLEAVPAYLDSAKDRARGPQVRLWQQLEIEAAGELPGLFDEVAGAGRGVVGAAEQRRLETAARTASEGIADYRRWLEGSLTTATDDWPIGRERHD
ncbi:MAG: DUF885 family protein, partial [Chloroflexi bacterium]|nr:DUF885 family protein [Chloroflexota bacterium]